MPKFEIKKFKSQRGMEGPGFSCDLYVDGVRGADVIDHGDGAPIYWFWFNQEAKRVFEAYVASQPEEPNEYGLPPSKPDADTVMSHIIDQFETRKKILRAAKTKCLFRLKDDGPDVAYRSLNIPYGPDAVKCLHDRFGDRLAEIINETLAKE
jgi:hypothetical protein